MHPNAQITREYRATLQGQIEARKAPSSANGAACGSQLNTAPLRRPVFPRGMGAASVGGEKTGGIITAASVATGPAAPFVAVAGALVSLISSFIGGGCGQACTTASTAEQIYDVAVLDLEAVGKLGMLTEDQFLTGAQNFLAAGIQHMQALAQTNPSATPAIKTMQANWPTEYNPSWPAPGSVPLDLAKAQAAYISGAGYYPAAVTAGGQLCTAYLQTLSSVSDSGVSLGGSSVPWTTIALGVGVLAVMFYAFSGGKN